MEQQYEAENLFDLFLEITGNSAENKKHITYYHALYALAVMVNMGNRKLLTIVGGDKETNMKVVSAMERIRDDIAKKEIHLDPILSLSPLYLPMIEKSLEVNFTIYQDSVEDVKKYQANPALNSKYLDNEMSFLTYALDLLESFKPSDGRNVGSFKFQGGFHEFLRAHTMDDSMERFSAGDFQKGLTANIRGSITASNNLYNTLMKTIEGQDDAVDQFTNAILESEIFRTKADRPQAVFLFAGPPGVGKTLLATETADALGRKTQIFDMSEYAGGDDSARGLIGFEPSYKNAQPGVLTSFVEKYPDSILVFDEIEKAAPSVKRLFLSVLEGARLTDRNTKRTVSFANTILVFTTNAGKELYEENENSNLSKLPVGAITEALKEDQEFPKELISRFASSNIICFNHLNFGSLISLAMRSINSEAEHLKENYQITSRYNQTLAHAFLLSEGTELDARMTTSRSRKKFRNLFFDLFREIEEMEEEHEISRIEVVCEQNEESEAYNYLYPNDRNAVHVLYITDKEEVQLSRNTWIDIRYAKTMQEMQDAFTNEKFDMVVVDLETGLDLQDRGSRSIVGLSNEGNHALNHLLQTAVQIPVYVADNPGITEADWRNLGIRGVYDKIVDIHAPKADEKWYFEVRKIYIQRSAGLLRQEEKVLAYNVRNEIVPGYGNKDIAVIRLSDFRLEDASYEGVEERKFDKEHLLTDVSRPKIGFADVIGAANAKRELRQFIAYAKNPARFEVKGVKVSKGLLLYGDPGTGKTMLAKAMAGESGMAFLNTTASELLQKGAEAVKQLFAAARRNSPSIVFIDEIDAVGKMRTGEETEREKVLNALLTEMDGFETNRRKLVFVIAATNYDLDGTRSGKHTVIDDALARRFGNRIYVDYPDRSEREKYIRMMLEEANQLSCVSPETIRTMSELTMGKTCSFIGQVIEFAVRKVCLSSLTETEDTNGQLTDGILLDCLEEFMNGERRGVRSSESTAVHEAGHVLIDYMNGVVPTFMSIVPRSHYNGYILPGNRNSDKDTKADLLGDIRRALAGRAAEVVFYGEEQGINTGASSDLRKATWLALNIVTRLGMHEDQLAVIPEDMQYQTPLSVEVMAQVNNILNEQYTETLRIIRENRHVVEALAEAVTEKTQLTKYEIIQVIEAQHNRH